MDSGPSQWASKVFPKFLVDYDEVAACWISPKWNYVFDTLLISVLPRRLNFNKSRCVTASKHICLDLYRDIKVWILNWPSRSWWSVRVPRPFDLCTERTRTLASKHCSSHGRGSLTSQQHCPINPKVKKILIVKIACRVAICRSGVCLHWKFTFRLPHVFFFLRFASISVTFKFVYVDFLFNRIKIRFLSQATIKSQPADHKLIETPQWPAPNGSTRSRLTERLDRRLLIRHWPNFVIRPEWAPRKPSRYPLNRCGWPKTIWPYTTHWWAMCRPVQRNKSKVKIHF